MTHWTQQQEELRQLRAQLAAALRTNEEVARRNIDLQIALTETQHELRQAERDISDLVRQMYELRERWVVKR